MQPPPLAPDEPMRLQALRELDLVETPLEERFERITRLARRLLQVDIAGISLVEADRQWFKSIQGAALTETDRNISFCGHAIIESDVLIVPDARDDPRFADNPLVTGPPQVVFYAACPIKSPDGFPIGAFCVKHSQPRTMSDDDVQTIRDFAAIAEAELQSASANAVQAELIENVAAEQRHALIDPLTRLWNREGILEVAQKALRACARGEIGVALVMVDLDHFKQVNDTRGHAVGDNVLRAYARRMLSAARESDVVGRIGGDEFLLILSPCDGERAAKHIAERIRTHLNSSPISHDGETIQVTASFGVRFIPPKTACLLDALLWSADGALYESKRRGRNQIAVSDGTTDAQSPAIPRRHVPTS